MTNRILFIDDIPEIWDEMLNALREAGFEAEAFLDPIAGVSAGIEGDYSLVITTLQMKKLGGFEVIRQLRGGGCRLPIIMITSFGTEQSAIEAVRLGFADYLTKPVEPDEVVARVRRVIAEHSTDRSEGPKSLARMVSANAAMREIFAKIEAIAPTDSRVLILGETGCGKQLLAQAVHEESPRAKQPFIEVNCAAIPPNLLESELFGHEAGAFTGATGKRIGRFEAAGAGTIFLDEIGELSFDLQSKLLHVLESGKFSRVGGSTVLKSKARLISATNRDLLHEIELGRFRADLFYRLNVIAIHLPPLRERPDDVSLLAEFFVQKFATNEAECPQFTRDALKVLERYHWPGNVRELQNMAEQLAVLHREPRIEVLDLPSRILDYVATPPSSPDVASEPIEEVLPFKEAKARFERGYVARLINDAQGNLAEAARVAGLDRSQFYRLAKKHGLAGKTLGR